jgi:putative transposase
VNEMPRTKREWHEGSVYHLFSRGSDRHNICVDVSDYFELATCFAAAAAKHRVDCFAWAFLPNHWHLLVRSPEAGLSWFVKALNHRYALRFNRRRERTAHVFQNRFGAVRQETQEQYLWTLRYILRNPFVAGVSPTIEDAVWTSYRATIGLVPAPPFLRAAEILDQFGLTPGAARAAFRDFVTSPTA